MRKQLLAGSALTMLMVVPIISAGVKGDGKTLLDIHREQKVGSIERHNKTIEALANFADSRFGECVEQYQQALARYKQLLMEQKVDASCEVSSTLATAEQRDQEIEAAYKIMKDAFLACAVQTHESAKSDVVSEAEQCKADIVRFEGEQVPGQSE